MQATDFKVTMKDSRERERERERETERQRERERELLPCPLRGLPQKDVAYL